MAKKCTHRIVVRTWGRIVGQVLSKRCSLSFGCGAPISLGPSNDDIPHAEMHLAELAMSDAYWERRELFDEGGFDWDVTRPIAEQWPWGPADPAHTARGDAQMDEIIAGSERLGAVLTAVASENDEARLDRLQAETASAMAALFASVAVPTRETAPDAFSPSDTASREPWHTTEETQSTGNSETIDALIERSSVGQGLRNIRENGIDAELKQLEEEMKLLPDAHGGADL